MTYKNHIGQRGEDALMEFMQSMKQDILDRMERSHLDNREKWAQHEQQAHSSINDWQSQHNGQSDDTTHAIINRKYNEHERKFWWMSGFAIGVGVALDKVIEMLRSVFK